VSLPVSRSGSEPGGDTYAQIRLPLRD